jgi:hypothetical protein
VKTHPNLVKLYFAFYAHTAELTAAFREMGIRGKGSPFLLYFQYRFQH